MKRTKIFVLLCAFVLALGNMAWADTAPTYGIIEAPLVDHGSDGNSNNAVTLLSYSATAETDGREGTAADPYIIKLTATDISKHYNADKTESFWIGVGIEKPSGDNQRTYDWGLGSLPNNGFNDKDPTSEMTDNGKKYDTFYWGNTPSLSFK